MEGNRPVGRRKRIGSGVGNVFRRPTGRRGATGGPVGDPLGYAGRRAGTPLGRLGGSGQRIGSGPPGGGRVPSVGCSPKLIPGLLVVAVIVVLVTYFGTCSGDDGTGTLPPGGTGVASGTSLGGISDAASSPVVTSVSQLARAKRTVLRGNGDDVVTVMVYMCATDLEAQSGMATADLNEMLHATISDKVNVIVETGGATSWRNSVISSTTNQRYRVTSQGLQPLERDLGKRSMVDPATLADFIQYSKRNYPADRYILVLWDHGGGSLTGFGYDQHFPRDSMTLSEVGSALRDGGCVFDVVGFDACLMSTLETAFVLEPYADYLIASEETEPGIGWYYTGWLSALSANTSVPTTSLGKTLIDDYVAHVGSQTPRSQATLSLVDLAELKGTVPSPFVAFATSTSRLIDTQQFKTVSDARAGAKEFSPSSRINQVDLIDFAGRIGTPEALALVDALRGCIKYNRTSTNIENANGLSIFFPHDRLSQLDSMLRTYDQAGISAEYSECIRSYASVTAGGQVTSSGSGNFLDVLLGGLLGGSQSPGAGPSGAGAVGSLLEAFLSRGDFGSITGLLGGAQGWVDTDRMRSYEGYYENNRFDASALVITEKNGARVLSLSEEQWSLVQDLEQNVFVDDGEGFIDLGLDNVYEYNDDGDLIMEYDGTWLALNGRIVSYYMTSTDRSGDGYSIKGRVPAMLNGRLVDIILVFDDSNPDGMVLGAQPRYDAATQTGTVAKGLLEIVAGDEIDYLCDYYTYEGEYDDTYFLGDRYTATGRWTIENLSIGGLDYQMTYRLTDIYNNRYWTPSVGD